MMSRTSTISTFAVAAMLAVAASIALTRLGSAPDASVAKMAALAARATQWTATAPGRVEPRYGEIRLSAQSPGRLVELAVRVNDAVSAGDLLGHVDDEEVRAKMTAAEAETGVRRRERDQEPPSGKLAQDHRTAEDTVAVAERTLHSARVEFDRVLRAWRSGDKSVTDMIVADARKAVTAARDRVEAERSALRRFLNTPNIPLPTRLESGLANSRSDLSQVEAALERTRLRAPSDGVILQINPKVGELIAASPEMTVLTIGDLSVLRVRAELEERDVSKVRIGQNVFVRTDAYPGRDFTGKVARISRTISPSKISQRGPRRPNDFDALEVMIELDPSDAVLPGMRVDVMFRPDATAEVVPAKAEGKTEPAPPKTEAPKIEVTAPKAEPPKAEAAPPKTEAKSPKK